MIEPIKRTPDAWNLCCNGCGEVTECRGRFHDVIERIKAQGWKIGKQPSGWTHTCPSCTDEKSAPVMDRKWG